MLRVLLPIFKPVNSLICCQDRFDVAGKTRNIAIQHVLQQCYRTSCALFVARFSVPLALSGRQFYSC